MVHIWTGKYGSNVQGDPARCREAVHEASGWGYYQCQRKATVFRCVDGVEYGFCRQHDPEAVAERRRKRNAEWDAKWKARDAASASAAREREALAACRVAVEQIAAGHNDPRTLATQVLAMFPSPTTPPGADR